MVSTAMAALVASGLYLNYVFTVVWVADAAWWLLSAASYARRPRWINATVHGFMAFMFFNATVVFGKGATRWLGAAVTAGLLTLRLRRPGPERDPAD